MKDNGPGLLINGGFTNYALNNCFKSISSFKSLFLLETGFFVASIYQSLTYQPLPPGFSFRKDELIGISVIPSLSMYYCKIVLHFCYDINASKKTTDQRSAIEVGMIFTMPSLSE